MITAGDGWAASDSYFKVTVVLDDSESRFL
jgi:hypothetical protein